MEYKHEEWGERETDGQGIVDKTRDTTARSTKRREGVIGTRERGE
jgi:hypothetical protein